MVEHPALAAGQPVDGLKHDRQLASCEGAPQVGATPLRRLTRTEYANSVRDLLRLPSFDASTLAADEKVGPFDSNTIAPVSELMIEQYARSAEIAVQRALAGLEDLVPCDRRARGDAACAAAFIERFGLRAYRRPLQAMERDAYRELYEAFAATGHREALRVITQTMLQSPNFLYHVELRPPLDQPSGATPLDSFELAARLAFFLLQSTPDDALLDSAAKGLLIQDDELAEQATRLLADERSQAALVAFHLQWLELGSMRDLTKDPARYPQFDAAFIAAMREDTVRFIDHVFRVGDGKLRTLLTAPLAFPRGPLLAVYGVEAAAAANTPVALDPEQRAGLLTQPTFLATHAHRDQSAPVLRGKTIIRNVLCQVLPDPPASVNTEAPEVSPSATTRERFAVHERNPSCAGCHILMDGIGFGFERYDAVGAFRTHEAGQRIDASGTISSSEDLDGRFADAVELAHRLADSPEVQDCVATQWFRFALGRFEGEADHCSLAELKASFSATDYDLRRLLKDIVLSEAFRMKYAPEASP